MFNKQVRVQSGLLLHFYFSVPPPQNKCLLGLDQGSNFSNQFRPTSRATPKLMPTDITDKGQEAVDFESQAEDSDPESLICVKFKQMLRKSMGLARWEAGLPTEKF